MYFAGKYKEHNDALNRFMRTFNNYAFNNGNEVRMYLEHNENYRDDGGIVYLPENIKVLYDFEKRHNYYPTFDKFSFKELGQFERKISKEEIHLSIQCSTDETGFIYAWHNDFKNEPIRSIKSKTSTGYESNGKRFTKNFKELSSQSMNKFYFDLLHAFKLKKFVLDKPIINQYKLL